jgi:thymidylate synthase ThyX
MNIIEPSFQFETPLTPDYCDFMYRLIERAARTCYKTECKISDDIVETRTFVRKIAQVKKHESVLEHASVSVRIICDRGVSHELVRHRLASYSQESTRYVSSVDRSQFVIETPDDVISAYERGMSMKRITALKKCTEWEVYKTLESNDVDRRPHHSPGVVHHDFFRIIDTPEKAYLLGFIQADGSVRRNTEPQVIITQHQDYFWFIHRMFRNFICDKAGFGYDRQCRNVSIVSKQLHSDLIEKGIVPNKTYEQTTADIDRLWNSVPASLIPDFLRGFLDGDGTVRFFTQPNPGETPSVNLSWCGHPDLLDRIGGWLHKNYDYPATVSLLKECKNQLSKIGIHTPQVAKRVCFDLYSHFQFPYGHPKKACRIMEQIGWNYPIASWGDPNFQVILPVWWKMQRIDAGFWTWMAAMDRSEDAYRELTELGSSPQEARSVLPNSLKTEIVMTANLREWKTVFKLRCDKSAHPQMRQLMMPLFTEFRRQMPEIYDDINTDIGWLEK